MPAARDHPVANPSPARAEPHDATAWLPLPDVEALPEINHLADPANAGGGGATPARAHRRRRRFHIPVRSLLVVLVVIGTVGGSVWAGAQVLDAGADVSLRVDGRTVEAETGVSTVASFLSEHKVDLGDDDRVVPSATADIENGMTVRVIRAFPVSVDFDGQQMTVYTTWREPNAFLKNLRLGSGEIGFRDLKAVPITEDETVILRTKKVGTLFLDGQAIAYRSPSYNVAELLEQYQVFLGPMDIATPPLGEVVPERGSVTVTRVATESETIDEPYTLPDELLPDPNLDVGQSRVEAAVTGLQRVTYQIIRHDDREAERIPISKVPINEAKPNITFYGTRYNPAWDKMAQCETGGNWAATGQRYQGGLGIFFQNWNYYGGREFAPTAGQATKFEQIVVAERIREEHGWRAWGCAKEIGL